MPKLPSGFRWLVVLLATVAAVTLGVFPRKASEKALATTGVIAWPAAAGRAAPERAKLVPSAARSAPRQALFTFVEPAAAAQLDAALPAPSPRIHYVQLDAALIAGKSSPFWRQPGAGRIEIPLPDGRTLPVVIDASEMLGPDRFTSAGRIEGRPQSLAVFAWHGGFLHASIEDPELGRFALRAATETLAQFYRIDAALVPPCGGERRPERAAGSLALSSAEPSGVVAAAVDNPQHGEVHVLMLYTPSVLTTLTGPARAAALQSAFDLAVAKVNAAFEASLISARVKLVGLVETNYDENLTSSARVQDEALTALYKADDGQMDEIHALRDAAGADIVCLALGRRDSASSGLSFLLDQAHDNENANFAFSVVQYTAIAGTNVVPHELGHVLGCAHDRENALSGRGAYEFSYGYRFFGADGRQYHDIMSYPPGTELSYFSNPNVFVPLPVNAPIGIVAGRPGESNSAQTIENTAFATAQYRLQTQAPPAAGTLINVATRAYVGTGEQVLIGGFVVEGPQPKALLIRAAGPSLANFGVAGALADPLLRIFAAGALTAENDNWNSPVGDGRAAAANEVAGVASRVRAFPFPAGSGDAALLITLPAGAYTAVVEGVHGTTGIGLIEAYDAGGDASRVLALATRGYADRNGKELYGGFVVQGAPGTTKRVLVRVLGPTLSRPPFNMTGVLDDPEMEIRNATGEIIIKNDDWSHFPAVGTTAEEDFRPLVEWHGEKQIFATGHAPGNRREPCVLVDLPPGSYSVIVQPFEMLDDTNPLRDQPAVPGVGVIEVYEIGR